MLYALHPKVLHTGAEYADLGKIIAGKVSPGALWKTDLTEANQELRVDAAYNAWWSALLPAEVTAAAGYPLPLFFQWDDIEYGYRAAEHGYPTVTLPGAGVWHADFTWKDWDDWSRYFSIRNSLITAALHSEFPVASIVRTLGSHLVVYTLAMQYGLAATVIKAIEDFLRGPEGLADGGQRVAAEVRELRKRYPETVMHPASEVPGLPLAGEPIERSAPPPSKLKAVLGKRLAYQLLGKTSGAVSVTLEDSQWWHVSLFRKVVVTDASEQGVRVREYQPELSRQLLREVAAVCVRLFREGPQAARQYREAVPSLTSRENWHRLFADSNE
jgi:galactofuranosylgalactofuranosylrhamnosyl-N-acetylglucosaminyl-diphospho-decaprenol beta-1,5/1,6-galactofuranosyltransferase